MALALVGETALPRHLILAGCRTLRLLRKEFVAAYVKYAFSDSVEGTYKEFERGFFKVCSMKVVDIFQPEELQLVMVGQEDYDWDQFKQVPGGEGDKGPENDRRFVAAGRLCLLENKNIARQRDTGPSSHFW